MFDRHCWSSLQRVYPLDQELEEQCLAAYPAPRLSRVAGTGALDRPTEKQKKKKNKKKGEDVKKKKRKEKKRKKTF